MDIYAFTNFDSSLLMKLGVQSLATEYISEKSNYNYAYITTIILRIT